MQITRQLERRIASFMQALKYFGKLPRPAGRLEQQVVDHVITLGYVKELNGMLIPRKEGKCIMK